MGATAGFSPPLAALQRRIVACRRCPRLVRYLGSIRRDHPDWWCRPVPAFGDPRARIVLLGLAPGRGGSNRTGRMFTGDASGRFLFRALHRLGLASQPDGSDPNDALRLRDVFITAVVRCAPPGNKPRPDEIRRCSRFAAEEVALLPNVRVVVALGRIAHDGWLRLVGETPARFPFRHGAVHGIPGGPPLVDSYHPSRQNTQTGRLTMPMFLAALRTAVRLAGLGGARLSSRS